MNHYRISKVTPGGKSVTISDIMADEYYISGSSVLNKVTTIHFRNAEKGWRGQTKSTTDVATIRFDGNILVETI